MGLAVPDFLVALADVVGLVATLDDVVLEVGMNLIDEFIEVVGIFAQISPDEFIVARMMLDVIPVDLSGLVSEVPNVVLVVEHLAVEGHRRCRVNGLGQGDVHVLPNLAHAEVGEDAFAANPVAQFFQHLVDEAFQIGKLGLYLVSVLTVEVHHGLHARGLAVDAPAATNLLDIQVIVEARVEFSHDLIVAVLAQDFACALGMELVNNKLYHRGHVAHSTFSIALQVGTL